LPAAALCSAAIPSANCVHCALLRIVSTIWLASPVSGAPSCAATARANPLQSLAWAAKFASHASFTGFGISPPPI